MNDSLVTGFSTFDLFSMIAQPTKLCPSCKFEKPTTEFGIRRNGYLRSYCKPCDNARYYQWRKANPEAVKKAQRKADLRLRHGISEELYNKLNTEQEGYCAICNQPPRRKSLVVDHDHTTDSIRGLLCDTCNRALGLFHDDVVVLKRALSYLKKAKIIQRDLPEGLRTR